MYSFFDLGNSAAARLAALSGAIALSAILMATAIVPASPVGPLAMGVLA